MRKKSAYGKKGGAKRSSLKRNAPVTMAAVQRYVRKVSPPPEIKHVRYALDEGVLNTLTASMSWTELSSPGWGTGPVNRVGNEIIAKRIRLTGVARNNSLSTTWLRFLILGYGPDVDLTAPEVFDALSSGAPETPLTVTGLNTIYTPIFKPKFRVFCDHRYNLGPSVSVDGSETKFFNKSVNLGNKKITFDANTTNEGNQTYRYAVVFWCATGDDDSIGTTMDLSYQTSFDFTDP